MRSISSRKVCANVLGGKSFWKDWRREAVLECSKGPGSSAKLYSSKSGEDRPSAIPDLGIAKAYDAADVEDKILEKWEKWKKYYRKEGLPPFKMVLPPPNVTGKLHLGHALTVAIEDSIARRLIMKGYDVQWIPGFDHAGIATQSVVSRKIEVSRSARAKNNIEKEIRIFAEQNMSTIREQLKATGALLDWDRTYYTLDENHSAVVQEAFVQLFESGLICRDDGIVNWCCSLQSSVADIEVDHVDFKGKITLKVPGCDIPVEFGVLYYCGYQLENSDEVLPVATSRPETIFGDVALAVNPNDSRYARFIGRKVINPLNNKSMPIVGDSRVKTDFGSGVVKITPAHDKLDFAIGKSHNLEKITVFTPDGRLDETIVPDYEGINRFSARDLVLDHLNKVGKLFDRKDYSGSFGLCNRTGDVIEPRVLPHWFLQTQNLTDKFLNSIRDGEFRIHPKNHTISLINYLNSCQNWCLSRQIKWGHSIPAYHHKDFPDVWVAATDINVAKNRLESRLGVSIDSTSDILQDNDVLDTWFSSALIPLSTSGWPDTNTPQKIGVMETGHDILLFWVWRMAIVTLALTDTLPFHNVLLHGIVNDHYGRKMSKSRGNVIDPMHVIAGMSREGLINEANKALACGELQQSEFELRIATIKDMYPQGFRRSGNDALRFSLLSQDITGEEIKLNLTYLENCRHFCNKIWQAFRFYTLQAKHFECDHLDGEIIKPDIHNIASVADHWLLACLHQFAEKACVSLDQHQFHLHSIAVRNFFQSQLCDVYIELIKSDLRSGRNIDQHLLVMRYALGTGLKLTHPLLPFVTEEMWSHLSKDEDSFILDQSFPHPGELACFENYQVDKTIQKVSQIAKEIRSIKIRAGLKGKKDTNVFVDIPSSKSNNQDVFAVKNLIESLSDSKIQFGVPNPVEKSQYLVVIFPFHEETCKVSLLKGEKTAADIEMEREKMLRMQEKLSKLKEQFQSKKFQRNASPAVKEKMRKKLEEIEMQLSAYNQSSNTDENTHNSPSNS